MSTDPSAPPPPAPGARPDAAPDLQVTGVATGTQINNTYEIEQLISAGGMGEVYRGRNIHNGEPVAIKIVLPSLAHDPKIVALFQKESTVLSRLSHEAIVRYHVFTKDPAIGRPCLIMEFVEGVPLSDRVERGPLPLDEVTLLLRRLASGLDKAHGVGVVHRDLSPDNVILEGGMVDHAKIIDFGIAKSASIGGGTLLQGQFAGKFNYVSPEQLGAFGGVVDGRSDIYSLGLLIAAAARGKVLDMGASIVDAVQSRQGVPELSAVPPALLPLLTHMLQPDPALRPATMADVIRLLDAPDQIPAPPPPPAADPNRTVIAVSLPPVALPPGMSGLPAQTGAPVQTGGFDAPRPVAPTGGASPGWPDSAPPTSPFGSAHPGAAAPSPGSVPPTASPGPAPQHSAPPHPGVASHSTPPPGWTAPPAAQGDASPFGAPAAGGAGLLDTATAKASPPPKQPEARQGGSRTMLLGIVALVALAGGAGAYFAGLFDPKTPGGGTVVATAPSAPAAPVPPAPQPPDPVTAAEPEPEPQPTPPPGPESAPEPEPESEPAPEPERRTEPDAAPAPIPESPPESPLDRLSRQLAWLRAYDIGPCAHVALQGAAGNRLALEGFGTDVAPFNALVSEFAAEFGSEPQVGLRLIQQQQCPVVDFVRTTGRRGTLAPPEILLDGNRDVLKSGEELRGRIVGLEGRSVALFLISHIGGATPLNSFLREEPGGVLSFGIPLRLPDGAAPRPLMILAVATEVELPLDQVPRGAQVGRLMPLLDSALAASGREASTVLSYFRLEQ